MIIDQITSMFSGGQGPTRGRVLAKTTLARMLQQIAESKSAEPEFVPEPQQAMQPSSQGFMPGPDYAFRLAQAQRGLDAGGAARGMLQSGAHLKRTQRMNQQMMGDEYNRYLDRLYALMSGGLSASNTAGAAGQGAANAMGQAYANSGYMQGQGQAAQYGAWGNALNSLGGVLGQYFDPFSGMNQSTLGGYGGYGDPSQWYGYGG